MDKDKSSNLRKAKAVKNDEFYTKLEDIETEILTHPDYIKQFEDKTVLCPCDDPEWSNFTKFFMAHFKELKIKELICTHFNTDGTSSYKWTYNGKIINKINLKSDGDFRSDEVKEIMKVHGENLIVATNVPFSLFREFIAQLMEFNCKYIVIGNKNAIAYKEIFPLLKDSDILPRLKAGASLNGMREVFEVVGVQST